ncbi:hypothetical protein N7540_000191 [Penicillium herquei]|nr:hypothetical protein N7540_000191 [Penicillium herquei]
MSEKDEKEAWLEALAPDPRFETDFNIPDNKFAFSPGQLNKLFNPKSLEVFYALGGLHGLEYGLQTDLAAGLPADETILSNHTTMTNARQAAYSQIMGAPSHLPHSQSHILETCQTATLFSDRHRVFGTNALPDARKKTFVKLLWDAYNDRIIILLTIAAVVSLSLGIYEAASGQSQVDWVEGVAVCVAILIVVSVTAGNDWQKQKQFGKLNRRVRTTIITEMRLDINWYCLKKLDRNVKVIRSGRTILMRISDLTVGDIVCLEPGEAAPADGIVVTSHEIKCDESLATGESDQVEKCSGFKAWDAAGIAQDMDPFIISGSKVLEGLGRYLVTSVGRHSTYGRIMVSLGTETDPTPLQVKLSRLASWIGWFGLGSALLLFTVLFIRFLVQLSGNDETPAVKGQHFMDILIVSVTVIVVAIPEGLPLAVTLALAFATGRMLKENNLVRLLRACETMGNATVICSDKTGTLTQNKMSVVVGFFGSNSTFGKTPLDTTESFISVSDIIPRFSSSFKDLILHSLALNTTAFEDQQEDGKKFIGNKTEVALLQLAHRDLGLNLDEIQATNPLEQIYPFDSARKTMAVLYGHPRGSGYRFMVKGAPEILLAAASGMVSLNPEGGEPAVSSISPYDRRLISEKIDSYAKASLRTIGIAYRDFPAWPSPTQDRRCNLDEIFCEMIWIGAFGIHDPLRPEVSEAINKCSAAGVQVKMVTGDNINTALSIAKACGIKTEDGIAMTGPELRKLGDDELAVVIPKLQVLARSSPEDKELLVKQLKRLGEIVAVTGDGTNDGPALKAADVGFSMGYSGTEVAKEASSIVLLDDNFRSIVTAIAWGRAVNDAVAKFLQFQITVNITAVLLTVITAIYSSKNESVFKAVQLLWLNLIMDTFAALALATDPPTTEILKRPPTPRSAPLFTVIMWKMILGQSIYKLAICFTLYFAGHSMFNFDQSNNAEMLELNTIIFNTFVWMQIFNEFNCRRLDNKFNIFEGIHKNKWFFMINLLMVGGQILIIFIGGRAFGVTKLSGWQWGVSLGFAIFCIPWAAILKLVPDSYVGVLLSGVTRETRIVFSLLLGAYKWMIRRPMRCIQTAIERLHSPRARVADEESADTNQEH